MKRLIFFYLLGVAFVGQAATGPESDVQLAAQRFVELLTQTNYPGAEQQFDATMAKALPEAALRQTWEAVQQQVGVFKRQLNIRTNRLEGYDVCLVGCEFEKAALDIKVVFDAQRRVAGLFFFPSAGLAESGGPPAYAQTNRFVERAITVGTGEWALPGTLTVPKSGGTPWPGVVLVHGSGPNDRDETVGGNKPFRDLAWGLATKGVAVLRYEKRTRQYSSRIAKSFPNLTVKEETIEDALVAVDTLRGTAGVAGDRVYVLGHSLGGMLAPRIAMSGSNIAGLIILAGAARPLEDLILEQTRYQTSLQGEPTESTKARVAEIEKEVAAVKALRPAHPGDENPLGAPASYWLDLKGYEPATVARGIRLPMLILQGESDCQVSAKADFALWRQALGARPDVTLRTYPALNHLFVHVDGQSTGAEYAKPGHVAEVVVSDIATWIKQEAGKR